MTDKEFKRLSRAQLIDVIYQLQLKHEELLAENERLEKELEDKRLRISKVGNIAEAALEIHDVMLAAQDAAAHYVEEIEVRANDEYQRICQEAQDKAALIIEKAQREADKIMSRAKKEKPDQDPIIAAILKEFGSYRYIQVNIHEANKKRHRISAHKASG